MKKYFKFLIWGLFFIFLTFNLFKITHWDWWWIVLPIWVAFTVFFLGLIIGIIFYQTTKKTEKRKWKIIKNKSKY